MRKTTLLPVLAALASALTESALSAAEPTSAFDWSGPYAGLNAGGVFNGKTRFDRTTGDLPNNVNALNTGLRPVRNTVSDSGFTGGGQVGYNHDLGSILIGIEADAVYADLDRTETLSNTTMVGPLGTVSTVPVTRNNQYRGQLDFLATARGRIGFALDRLLVYGTGGLAYGHVKQETIYYGPNAASTPFFAGRNKKMKGGYVYGGGVEFAMPTNSFLNVFGSSAVTVRAEYLHYDLGHSTLRFPGVNGGSEIGAYTSRVRSYGDLVRAGINYKF